MKPATAGLTVLINAAGGQTPLVFWDCFTLRLLGGGLLLYTTAPFPIFPADATIWNPPAIDNSGGMWSSSISWRPAVLDMGAAPLGHWKRGLDSDSFSFTIAPRSFDLFSGAAYPDKIGSVPWLQAARAGALDYADVIWSRAYFASVPAHPIPVAGLSPVGTVIMQRGIAGQVDVSSSLAVITVNDYKSILNQAIPRNAYQASCRHRLFDTRCGLSAGGYTASAVAGAGSTQGNIVAALAAPAGSGTYALGTLAFTAGLNVGVSRMVAAWDGATNFALLSPFPFAVALGDAFTVTAGCDKSTATCTAFGNLVNYGGEPYIPPPEVVIG